MKDSYRSRSTLPAGKKSCTIWRLGALADRFDVAGLPFAHKVLLENLLRCEDGVTVTAGERA